MSRLRTQIHSVAPERVTLTVHGQARLRVVGRAYGALRCADERRWVWGAFDETFCVVAGQGPLEIAAFGIGGVVRRQLVLAPARDLRPRSVPTPGRRVRWSRLATPHVAPLTPASLAPHASTASTLDEPSS